MNPLFNSTYSLDDLICHLTNGENDTFYLNSDNGEITKTKPANAVNHFAFKPLKKETVIKDLAIDSKLTLNQLINQENTHQRIVYNYVKDKAIEFLSDNKLLPPSLNPILTFKENKQMSKIKIEIE